MNEEPPEDETLKHFDPAIVEEGLNAWLAHVAEFTGQQPKTVKELSATGLSEHEVLVLRSILTNEEDRERLKLMRKIWSVVLPKKEVELLFGEVEEKLLSAGDHH